MIGGMEPTHDDLMLATRLQREDAATARAGLAVARASYAATRDRMYLTLVEAQWPRAVGASSNDRA